MKTLDVEIFATGKWNGINVTPKMLSELANNFTRLSSTVDVPLKFGHNDEQPMTDGQPALGWVSKVWVEGEKLFATFIDMPEIVYNAMKKKLYKNVSIEALFNVSHKKVEYGTVLTAVALLGADMPAVNTLSDLKTYMTANNLAFSNHATFSKEPQSTNFNSESSTMNEKEQAEFDAMKAKVEAQQKVIDDNATASAKFTADSAKDKATIQSLEDEKKATAFAAEKNSVNAELETLVKAGKCTPAQRDDLIKDFTAETAANVKFTIGVLKGSTGNGMNTDEQGQEHNQDDKDKGNLSASDRVDMAAHKLIAANSELQYDEAVKSVFAADPKLAGEFATENDGE